MTKKAARVEINKTGEPLFQALGDTYMKVELKTLPYKPACFAGGTLVHTKNGLVPIEQIQVGDWVLSKHESGEGEREYKRVTKTFVHEDREVNLLTVRNRQEDASEQYLYFVVTPEHPIWVQGKGWKEARQLNLSVPLTLVELLQAGVPIVGRNTRLFVTDQDNVAWFPMTSSPSDLQYKGGHINVNTLEIPYENFSLNIDYVSNTKRVKPEHLFRTTVYNLEVEDFHTYYVGKAGMWVHNKLSTVTASRKVRKVSNQVFPDPGGYVLPKDHNISVYQGKGEAYGALNKEGAEIKSGIILVPARSDDSEGNIRST